MKDRRSFRFVRQFYKGFLQSIIGEMLIDFNIFDAPCKPLWKEQLSIELNFPQILRDMIDDELFC